MLACMLGETLSMSGWCVCLCGAVPCFDAEEDLRGENLCQGLLGHWFSIGLHFGYGQGVGSLFINGGWFSQR